MAKGDAFNRSEVSSVYVSPRDRYVVSFIVGYSAEQVDNTAQAAAAAVQMLTGEDSSLAHISVCDRHTGETVDLTLEEVSMFMRPRERGAGS
jgi:hypothetical protein